MSGVSPDLREGLDLLQALKSQPDETLRQRFREAIAMYERVVVPRMDYWDKEEWESAKAERVRNSELQRYARNKRRRKRMARRTKTSKPRKYGDNGSAT